MLEYVASNGTLEVSVISVMLLKEAKNSSSSLIELLSIPKTEHVGTITLNKAITSRDFYARQDFPQVSKYVISIPSIPSITENRG